jgi:hypothetical protein
MSTEVEQKTGVFSILFSLVKKILILLLPSLTLLKLNFLLTRTQKIISSDYLSQQKKRNYIISLCLIIPLGLSILLAIFIISKDKLLFQQLAYAKENLSKGIILTFFKNIYIAFFDEQSIGYLVNSAKMLGIGSILSMIMGFIALKNMDIIKQTKLLEDLLKRNGIFEKDDTNRIVLATPIGFLIDITGSSAKELMFNERIWMALNIKVKDYIEDPNKRAIVFFKKSYELQNKYIYKFDKQK